MHINPGVAGVYRSTETIISGSTTVIAKMGGSKIGSPLTKGGWQPCSKD